MDDLAQLLESALRLDRKDRALLADRLLDSLDDAPGAKSGEEWLDIACSRLEEIRSGKVETIPAAEVLADLSRFHNR